MREEGEREKERKVSRSTCTVLKNVNRHSVID